MNMSQIDKLQCEGIALLLMGIANSLVKMLGDEADVGGIRKTAEAYWRKVYVTTHADTLVENIFGELAEPIDNSVDT